MSGAATSTPRYDDPVLPRQSRRPFVAPAASLLALASLLAACGDTGPTRTPDGTAGPAPGASEPALTPNPTEPALTPVPGGTSEPAPSGEVTQTDTAWGRIWDALPPSFPRYPGSIPTEAIDGPVSGSFAIGAPAQEATAAMQAALELAGYSTVALSGPFEDGSLVIESSGEAPGCRIETRLTPLSGTVQMTVLFAAGCPFE